MITTLLVIGLVWAYVFLGCIAYRITLNYGRKHGWSSSDMSFTSHISGVFWPLLAGFWAAWLPIRTMMRATNRMVEFIFSAPEKVMARKNKIRLPIAKLVK